MWIVFLQISPGIQLDRYILGSKGMDNCIHCMLYSGTHLKKISGPARQVSSEKKKIILAQILQ